MFIFTIINFKFFYFLFFYLLINIIKYIQYINYYKFGDYINGNKDIIFTTLIFIATFYIPFLLAFFSHYKLELDKKIFLTYFNIKKVIIVFLLAFLILMFWQSGKGNNNIIIFSIDFILIIYLIVALFKIIDFFSLSSRELNKKKLELLNSNKENDFEILLFFLQKEKKKDEIGKDFYNENYKEIINIILEKVFLFLKNKRNTYNNYKQIDNIDKLLIEINFIIKEKSIINLYYGENTFEKIIKIYKNIVEKENNNSLYFGEFRQNIEDIIITIFNDKILRKEHILIFYNYLKNDKNNNSVLENLYILILNNKFLDNKKDFILEKFPYKINIKNFQKKEVFILENYIIYYILKKFNIKELGYASLFSSSNLKIDSIENNIKKSIEYLFIDINDKISLESVLFTTIILSSFDVKIIKKYKLYTISQFVIYDFYTSNNYIDNFEKLVFILINKDKLKISVEYWIQEKNNIEKKYHNYDFLKGINLLNNIINKKRTNY